MFSFIARLRSKSSKKIKDSDAPQCNESTQNEQKEDSKDDDELEIKSTQNEETKNEETKPTTTTDTQSKSKKQKHKKGTKKSINTKQNKKGTKKTNKSIQKRNTSQSLHKTNNTKKSLNKKKQNNKKKDNMEKPLKDKTPKKIKKKQKRDKKQKNIQKTKKNDKTPKKSDKTPKKVKKQKNTTQNQKKDTNTEKNTKRTRNKQEKKVTFKNQQKDKKDKKQKKTTKKSLKNGKKDIKQEKSTTKSPKNNKKENKKQTKQTINGKKKQRSKSNAILKVQKQKKKVETSEQNKKQKKKKKENKKQTKQSINGNKKQRSKSNAIQKVQKEKKKKEDRKDIRRKKDIESAKRRLNKRLSITESTIIIDPDALNMAAPEDNNNIWSDYVSKYGNEPQNASEIHSFSKTDSKYTLSYKECRIIFIKYNNGKEELSPSTTKEKEDRDKIYTNRDSIKAKKRLNHRFHIKQNGIKEEEYESDMMQEDEEDDYHLNVMNHKRSRSQPRSRSQDDASWMTHKSEDKSGSELIKENILTQKQLYLSSLSQCNSLEKKKEIGRLFDRHIQHAKVNGIISNGDVENAEFNIINTSKLMERLKDEEKALSCAVDIVKDLGFLKRIKDDDVYGKIYIKRCLIDDYDLFDMNNIDILSKFEGSLRDTLSKVICSAIVSIESLEIVEICNADIGDDFMEMFIEYLMEYYSNNKYNRHITILSLQSNPISDRGMVYLTKLIEMNHSVLNTIKLQNNRIDISTPICQQICESLERNEFIIKFEFEFRHYQWRDYRDRVIKRNFEKARMQRLQKAMSI